MSRASFRSLSPIRCKLFRTFDFLSLGIEQRADGDRHLELIEAGDFNAETPHHGGRSLETLLSPPVLAAVKHRIYGGQALQSSCRVLIAQTLCFSRGRTTAMEEEKEEEEE